LLSEIIKAAAAAQAASSKQQAVAAIADLSQNVACHFSSSSFTTPP
jgi:hypothetical protein